MFANLFHHLVDARRRMDIATLDDRLLEDVGLTRDDLGMGSVDVVEIAEASAFPIHDVWSNRPLIRIAPPLRG